MDFQTTLDALRTPDNTSYIDAVFTLYKMHTFLLATQDPDVDMTNFNRRFFEYLKTEDGKAAVENAIAIAEEAA